MDRLSGLGNQLSQLTMYDIKSYYNQAKNMVLNVSEMEAKVKEATNEDPWGASSTLMQDIAQGTFNFQQFNEIMPCIYSRFIEKEARQWREIYKALQLLEYIIKHGSERVVDDARSHLSTIKMLRSFHYIDEKGKDQGINVRNRANEISSLLVDLDKIRTERRKAKANKAKYTGISSDFGGGGGRFGSDSFYESRYSNNGGYGGGGGGSSSSGFRDDAGRKGYEEYDAGEYEDARSPRRAAAASPVTPVPPTSPHASASANATTAPASNSKAKEKVVAVDDLLGDWTETSATAATTTTSAASPASPNNMKSKTGANVLDGDDFDDFQSAPVSPPPTFSALAPTVQTLASPSGPVASQGVKPNLFDLLNQSPPTASVSHRQSVSVPQPAPGWQQPQQPQLTQQPAMQPQIQPVRPNYFGGATATATATTAPTTPSMGSTFSPLGAGTRATQTQAQTQGHAPSRSNSNFDELWSLGLNASGKTSAPTASGGEKGKSMKDLEREKARAGIWGSGTQHAASSGGGGGPGAPGSASMGGGGGFGAFSGSGGASSNFENDDLLL